MEKGGSMKLYLIILAVLLLAGCATPTTPGDTTPPAFQCPSLNEGRGLTVDFIEGAPPSTIKEHRPFTLGLKFSNHLDIPVNAYLTLQDSVDHQGFPEEGI